MTKLKIIKAEKKDNKIIKKLLKILYPAKKIKDIKEKIHNKKFFIAKYGKKAIGLISLRKIIGPFGWINHLVVNPKYRQKGIGRKLLKKAFTFAKKQSCNILFLTVLRNPLKRKNAHKFYIANKFKNISLFYYRKI